MDKKGIGKRLLLLTLVFAIGLVLFVVFFLLVNKQIIKIEFLYKYKNLLWIALLLLVFWYFYIFFKIIFGKAHKKVVKNINTAKIKDFGVAKWMHNEILNFDPNQVEKSLKEFHHYFNCDEINCSKKKDKKKVGERIKNPEWVINIQYRTKNKNILVIPPIATDYEKYDGKNNILDTDRYKKAINKWETNLAKNHKKYNFIYHTVEKMHVIVIGATGSGKTEKLIFPGVLRNSMISEEKQPTMIITDPKGEIYEKTSGYLETQGYDVKVLNFRDTTSSWSWNPLLISWTYRKEAINYKQDFCFTKTFSNLVTVKEFINNQIVELKGQKTELRCSIHDLKQCEDCIKEFENNVINSGWEKGEEIKLFVSNGRFHTNEYDFDTKVENYIQNLKSLSEKEIMSLANIIIQPGATGDPFWTDSAKTVFVGIATIMLEIMDKNQEKMPLEKFNIVNILKMVDSPQLNKWILDYQKTTQTNNEDSFGLNQILTVVNSAEETQKSILTTVKTGTTLYTFTSIQGLLCSTKNLIDMEAIAYGEKPTILYLIIPDDDKIFHPLVACFVDQFYKISVKVATNNKISGRLKESTLSRQVQFYLDEFGNFPKIPSFPQMITVARSRNIFFMLILQDYNQLITAYGNEESETIKHNCNTSIYIRTNSYKTAEELSKEYGEKPIIAFSVNDNFGRSNSKTQNDKKVEETTNATTVPLLRPNEILNLDENFLIVKKTGKNPALIHALYSYKVNIFKEYMGCKRSFVPSNSINYKRDHYFNFVDENYEELIKHESKTEELDYQEELNSFSIEELKFDSEFNNNVEVEDYHDFLIQEQNKNINKQKTIIKRVQEKQRESEKDENDLMSMFYKIEESFIDKKTLTDQIKKNYLKLETIKEKYYKYENLLPSELSSKEKQDYNQLYEQQLQIAEENKQLLEKCKNSKY